MRLTAINRTKGAILCPNLAVASGLIGKSIGLIGRDRLDPGQGMLFDAGLLDPFMLMHTMFMRFAIDVVFLDRLGRVIAIDHEVAPWRVSSIAIGARRALELPAGTADRTATQIGDVVAIDRV